MLRIAQLEIRKTSYREVERREREREKLSVTLI